MPFTIHREVTELEQVAHCEDGRDAKIIARKHSLHDMQSFVIIQNDEKEVIAVCYKGEIFERRIAERE